MSKIISHFIFLFIICITISFNGYAQKNKSKFLKYYLSHIDFLLKDGGKWKTDNKDFNALEDSSANYYLIEYTKGTDGNTLNFKLTGYISQKAQWLTFQEGFYKWDDMKQAVVYHSSVVNKIKVDGESKVITSKLMSFNSLISSPVDKPDALTTTIKFTGNQIEETQYYNVDNYCLGLTWDKAVWNRTF